MAISLFKNLISYIFSNEAEKVADSKPLKYIAAGNGAFEVRTNKLMEVTKKLDSVPNLPALKEGIKLHIPKIPFQVFNVMVSFMREVYDADSTESTIMLFYNEESKEFIPWVPLQENGAASSDYKRDEDPNYTKMCKENVLVLVAHSHPWGSGGVAVTSPTPSGIDNKDEKETLFYMVVGNVKGVPTTYVSTCPGGSRMKLNFFEVFENPLLPSGATEQVETLIAKYIPDHEIFPTFVDTSVDVPRTWFKQCKKRTYRYTGYYSSPNRGLGTLDDPARQYANRAYGYDDVEDYYGEDFAYYSNYYSPATEAHREALENMPEGELEKLYKDRFLSRGEAVEVEAHVLDDTDEDDLASYEYADVLDACLGFDDLHIAKLMIALIHEGKGSVIHKCLNMKEDRTTPIALPAKSGDIPGLKLTRHNKHKGGKGHADTKGT